jgi:5-hydroxyisourate hydrolase-like protein (transthyretin family)
MPGNPSISTHVLNLENGLPAAGVVVTLERERDGTFEPLAEARTNEDGGILDLLQAPLTSARLACSTNQPTPLIECLT